jgi:hypothetical protein
VERNKHRVAEKQMLYEDYSETNKQEWLYLICIDNYKTVAPLRYGCPHVNFELFAGAQEGN